jgi:hypothetical protein
MVLSMPRRRRRPTPQVHALVAGTACWRIHSDQLGPVELNSTIPAPFAGGRFDCTDGSYSYLYAGSDSIAAVAETLLRDRPQTGPYLILRKALQGRTLSKLRLTRSLKVVALHGAGLTAIRQKADLTASGPDQYDKTRAWAVALRADAPAAAGFEWRPRHDNDRFAYVFFGDRSASADFEHQRSYALTDGRGFWLVKRALAKHGATVA